MPPSNICPLLVKKKTNHHHHPQLLFKEIRYYCQGIWQDAVMRICISHYSDHFPYKIENIGTWEVHVTTAEERNENGRMLLHMPRLNMWIFVQPHTLIYFASFSTVECFKMHCSVSQWLVMHLQCECVQLCQTRKNDFPTLFNALFLCDNRNDHHSNVLFLQCTEHLPFLCKT